MKKIYYSIILISIGSSQNSISQTTSQRPNILLIMADDMGFSDLGCYGSEIHTPNIDNLAQNGLRYSQFYNGARSCPTRAALLTGAYAHQAGMGWMAAANLGTTPAYNGDLNNSVVTIAEVLSSAGYKTYMTGKWHVTNERKMRGNVTDNWPSERGFNHFFGIIGGAGNYFTLPVYSNNEKLTAPKDENFYFTHAITDSTISYIDNHVASHTNSPMFMYVAYTAPHWPLHALDSDIEKYQEVYEAGWDELRNRRLNKQVDIGLFESDIKLSERDHEIPSWSSLTENKKKDFARRMAIYAAQIDAMDQGIGKIVTKLKETNQFDNTIIIFLSDNGACAEYISSGESTDLNGDLSKTWESYRINWANVSSTPFREYKHWIHEGGIRTPLIVHWPNGIDKSLENSFVENYGHIVDVMATCVDVSNATYPVQYKHYEIVPLQGVSLAPHFKGESNNRKPIFWEHEGNIGMRDGQWKLVMKTPQDSTFSTKRLELYDINLDPTELINLSEEYPQRTTDMYNEWWEWGNYVGVFPIVTREYNIRAQAFKRDINGEFDDNFGDWNIRNKGERADFAIDKNNLISGENSAKITILGKSMQNEDIGLVWNFNSGPSKSFEISFQAFANKRATIEVRMEEVGKSSNTLITTKTFTINKSKNTFVIDTKDFERSGQMRLGFYVGHNEVGSEIFIDKVELKLGE